MQRFESRFARWPSGPARFRKIQRVIRAVAGELKLSDEIPLSPDNKRAFEVRPHPHIPITVIRTEKLLHNIAGAVA